MTLVTAFIAGFALCAALAAAGFVWVNRNKADQLDRAEGTIRDFKKP